MQNPHRRGATALPWILCLAVVLVMMGVSGSFQVSAARQALERIHARRVVDLAAANAFEEVAARLENQLPRVPTPGPDASRDLGSAVLAPREVEPVLTRESMQDDRVELSAVNVRSSPWKLEMKKIARGAWKVSERGIVEMAVTVTVQAGTTRIRRTVTTRRFARASPELGETRSRFHLEATPFVRKMAGT